MPKVECTGRRAQTIANAEALAEERYRASAEMHAETRRLRAAYRYDPLDTRFDPPDVAAIRDAFGLDRSTWPGWALQWERDPFADTSAYTREPWCKRHHRSASYYEWQPPRAWAVSWPDNMPVGTGLSADELLYGERNDD